MRTFRRRSTPRLLRSEYLDSAGVSLSTTAYTFADRSLGEDGTGRKILVGVAGFNGTAQTVSTVTVAGVAATPVGSAITYNGGESTANLYMRFYLAEVPAGSVTGDVVITWSASVIRTGIIMWKLLNLQSGAPRDELSITGSDPLSGQIDTESGGGTFAMAFMPVAATFAWSGLAEDVDAVQLGASNRVISGASALFGHKLVNRTVTADQSATGTQAALKVVSLR